MKRKEDVDFEIFIISRFLVSLISVIMAELLMLLIVNFLQDQWLSGRPLIWLLVTIVLFLLPILLASALFTKIVLDEVEKLEEEKARFQREYEKRRNLMLSDIAHDLRTPITTIYGYARALTDGMVEDPKKQTEYLEAIRSKSERMNQLISLLYEYVKLDSDNFSLHRQVSDLSEVLRENAALLYSDAEEAGMELIAEIPEEAVPMDMDAIQVSRVISNLITNSIRHNGTGTKIMLELKKDAVGYEIAISDDGDLIEAEMAEHIFEPFTMGDRSRQSGGGSGLGLSIAMRIVQMHGWRLRLCQNENGYRKAFIINTK